MSGSSAANEKLWGRNGNLNTFCHSQTRPASRTRKQTEYYDLLHPHIPKVSRRIYRGNWRDSTLELLTTKVTPIKQAIQSKRSQEHSKRIVYTNLIAKTVKVGILVTQKKGKATNAILMHLQQHNNYWIKWQDVSYMDSKEDWKQNYINAIDRKVSMSPLKKTATRPSFENRRNFWWRHHCNFNSLFANQMSDFHRSLTQANNLLKLQ